MSGVHTPATVAALITARIEPSIADEVLAALHTVNGHPITPQLLDTLPGGSVEWHLRRQLGATALCNRANVANAREGLRLTLAHSETPGPLDAAWVEQENPEAFAHRRSRNAQRAALLADTERLAAIAQAMNEAEAAAHALAEVRQKVQAFFESHPDFAVDRLALERAAGLRGDRGP